MTKPKITVKTVSDEIITAANAVETITVGQMTIGLKKPGILSQYRIVEVVGESAKNQVYMGMIMPLLWVVEIDGHSEPLPSTKRELEALIQRLGEDSINAIMEHIDSTVSVDAVSTESVKN